MARIGLTGGIASGKSAVAALLAERGATIIDADLLARAVVEPGTPALAAIRRQFGETVIADGRLDRAALGRIVFDDPVARRDLEAIVHPAVRRRAEELQARAPADGVVVQVIPLLVETGQAADFDLVLVIDLDEATQRARLRARSGLAPAEIEARIAAQMTREERLAHADLVVDNSGTPADLAVQIDALWPTLAAYGTGEISSSRSVPGETAT